MKIKDSWIIKQPIAHRGYHTKDLPENTTGAFLNAIKHDFAIELDVRMLKDGTVVVFHDHNLFRLTGKKGDINDITAEELKDYKIAGTDCNIPTLSEVLELVNGRTPILIEIKNEGKAGKLEENVYNLLKDYKGDFAIQSFNPFTVNWFKKYAPNILRGQLYGKVSFFVKFIIKKMWFNKFTKPHFVAYQTNFLPNKYVKKSKSLPILAWVVNSKDEEDRIKKYVNNIIFENFNPFEE